jgi:hypothetical protein
MGGVDLFRQQSSAKRRFAAFSVCHFLDIQEGPNAKEHQCKRAPMSVTRDGTRIRRLRRRQTQPNEQGSVRAKMTTDKRSIMMTRIGSIISSREGSLVGDILWFAAIAFIFSIVTGIVG